jgi:5-methylcytosine-specific restriction endonuclease McrA
MSSKRKRCRTCRRILPLTEFYDQPTNADRFSNICKADCRKARLRRYYQDPNARRRGTEQVRQWKKQNPLRAKAQQAAATANARALKRGISGRITGRDVIRAWEASDYHCAVCDKDLSRKDGDLSLDHRHPMEFGGPNAPDNLRAACRSCNPREYWMWRREFGKKRAA